MVKASDFWDPYDGVSLLVLSKVSLASVTTTRPMSRILSAF